MSDQDKPLICRPCGEPLPAIKGGYKCSCGKLYWTSTGPGPLEAGDVLISGKEQRVHCPSETEDDA